MELIGWIYDCDLDEIVVGVDLVRLASEFSARVIITQQLTEFWSLKLLLSRRESGKCVINRIKLVYIRNFK